MDRPDYNIRGEPARLIHVVADTGKDDRPNSLIVVNTGRRNWSKQDT